MNTTPKIKCFDCRKRTEFKDIVAGFICKSCAEKKIEKASAEDFYGKVQP